MRLGNSKQFEAILSGKKIRVDLPLLFIDIEDLDFILIEDVQIIIFPIKNGKNSYSFEWDIMKQMQYNTKIVKTTYFQHPSGKQNSNIILSVGYKLENEIRVDINRWFQFSIVRIEDNQLILSYYDNPIMSIYCFLHSLALVLMYYILT